MRRVERRSVVIYFAMTYRTQSTGIQYAVTEVNGRPARGPRQCPRRQGAREGKKQQLQRIITAAAVALFVIAAACRPMGAQDSGGLRNPAGLTEQAPAMFQAAFDTSKGRFVVDVHRDWAPIGADRFYNLVKSGFSMVSDSSGSSPGSWRNSACTAIRQFRRRGGMPWLKTIR